MRHVLLGALALAFAAAAGAQSSAPLPAPVDWRAEGIAVGLPPAPEKRVTKSNALAWPQISWTLQHTREIFPSRTIARAGAVSQLPSAPKPLAFSFNDDKGEPLSFADFPARAYLDALVIVRDGRVVHESYRNSMRPDTPHLLFSVSKSFTGLVAEMAIADGKLDPAKRVDYYLPELKGSAWADATVRDVLDMRDGVSFREDYLDPKADIFAYAAAWGWGELPDGTAAPDGFNMALRQHKDRFDKPGGAFRYRSAATDVIGWIVSRVEGKPLAEVISERIWAPLGAEHDAFILLDRAGQEVAAGGMNATARDLARFGEMLRNNGRFNGRQIAPESVMQSIRNGGDRDAYTASNPPASRRGWSYRSQFWISHDADGAFTALGVRGQRVHVNPAAKMVVVTLGAHAFPGTSFTEALHQNFYAALKTNLK